MLTDKQSLILCSIVAFGFVLAGVFGILYNLAILGLLLVGIIILIVNIVIIMRREIESPSKSEKSDSDS